MVIISKVIGIYFSSWRQNYGSSLRELYNKNVWIKANPRDEEYMKNLFLEKYPQGTFLNVNNEHDWEKHISSADTILLLFPDSIGIGFCKVESIVFKYKKKWASVRVINGRKREFLINRVTKKDLYLRRFIERSLLVEFMALIGFLVLTPVFLIFDWVRGRL